MNLLQTQEQLIIEQIAARDERALEALAAAYGKICRKTAQNILGSEKDAEEAFNDALFRAWNAIPAHPPAHLQAYLITLTRRIALDRCKAQNRMKRGGGQTEVALSELEECLAAPESVEAVLDRHALLAEIELFLQQLTPEKRRIFIERYTMLMPTGDIALRHGLTDAAVKMTLSRLRRSLREQLEKGGYL